MKIIAGEREREREREREGGEGGSSKKIITIMIINRIKPFSPHFRRLWFLLFFNLILKSAGAASAGAVAQSVERTTSGQDVIDSIPALSVRSLLVGSESV